MPPLCAFVFMSFIVHDRASARQRNEDTLEAILAGGPSHSLALCADSWASVIGDRKALLPVGQRDKGFL